MQLILILGNHNNSHTPSLKHNFFLFSFWPLLDYAVYFLNSSFVILRQQALTLTYNYKYFTIITLYHVEYWTIKVVAS